MDTAEDLDNINVSRTLIELRNWVTVGQVQPVKTYDSVCKQACSRDRLVCFHPACGEYVVDCLHKEFCVLSHALFGCWFHTSLFWSMLKNGKVSQVVITVIGSHCYMML